MNEQALTVQQPAPTLPNLPKLSEIAMEFWEELLRGVVPSSGETPTVGGKGGGWR